MRNFARALWGAFDLRDVFWVSGLACVAWGAWQVYQPAAFIVTGAALFWLGAIRSTNKGS